MMKQTKWLVSLSAYLVLIGVSAAGAKGKLPGSALNVELQGNRLYQDKDSSLANPRQARELAGFDTIRRCSPSLPDWIRSGRERTPY